MHGLATPTRFPAQLSPNWNLPEPGDPLYKRAFAVIEDAIEAKFYNDYKNYASAGNFDVITEPQFVGFLAHKGTRPNRAAATRNC